MSDLNLKTSELRDIATGQQPYATLESKLADEVIRLRQVLAHIAARATIPYEDLWCGYLAYCALRGEHDEAPPNDETLSNIAPDLEGYHDDS